MKILRRGVNKLLELTKALKAKCATLNLRYVPGAGNPSSKLWLIGEAPGEEEEAALQPFVGKSGGMLNGCLRNSGIDRNNCFVSNIYPVRPPGNKLYRLDETGLTFAECIQAFKEQVDLFKPNAILALGGASFEALVGKYEGIQRWRGYIQTCGESKVIGSFHPSYILHKNEKSAKKETEGKGGIKYTYGTSRLTLILDMQRAKEEAAFRGINIPKRTLLWDIDQVELTSLLDRFLLEPELAFDIETQGSWIDRIAFAGKDVAVSFLLARAKEPVAKILAEHKGLIGQNVMFDVQKLKQAGMPVSSIYGDSMVLHHLLYPEFPHGLDYLASIFLRLTEQPHCSDWDLPENRSRKNAEHAAITLEIHKILEKEAKELETEN